MSEAQTYKNLKRKRGPAVRGRDRTYYLQGEIDTNTPTELGRIFSPCHSIDILLFIAGNPCCMKTDLYRKVSRNTSTSAKLEMMVDAGLLTIEDCGRTVFLTLTDRGYAVAELFHQAEYIIRTDEMEC